VGYMRLRRSVKIAPGIRLNVTKTGIGLSAGVRGARYSVHSSGRTTRTVGIPGTGVSYMSVQGRSQAGATPGAQPRQVVRAAAPVVVSGAQAAPFLPKAGLFASAAEKRYREGLVAYLTDNKPAAIAAFEATLVADPGAMSAHLLAAIAIDTDVDMVSVIRHLEAVVTTHAIFPDKYQAKFLPADRSQMQLDVKITELISARVPFDATGATLLLAEAYQQSGRLEEAIGLVQQLHEANPHDPAIQLSLADLLFADGDYDSVVEVAGHARNDDNLTVALIHMRAAALSALGHQTAAFDSFRDALAKTANRDEGLLATVRYDRALALEQAGQKAKAKADYERLYASEPGYRDVRERLAALG
jgi:tetratricopeptide (TPR) repeat protein